MSENVTGAASSSSDLSTVVIPLLKGVVYADEDARLWSALLELRVQVRDYVSVLGLELALDEAEGYAFLRSREVDPDDPGSNVSRLVARRQLSYPVSLILALLRKKLAEFDAGGSEVRLVLTRDEMVEMIRVFLPEASNEVRLVDQIDAHLNKVVDLGFLRRLGGVVGDRSRNRSFEVRRIVKAFVDAQWLSDFDQRLRDYEQVLATRGEEQADE